MKSLRAWAVVGMTAILVTGTATRTHARMDPVELAEFKAGFPELFQDQGNPRVQPMDVPDIFGPGAVLNVGHVFMKVTNLAVIGNSFNNAPTDPSAQWPGASGI